MAFSAISQGAVGTMTPLGSVVSTTAGAASWRGGAARAGTRVLRRAWRSGATRPARPRRARRAAGIGGGRGGGLRRGRGRRRVGAAVRWEGLHGASLPDSPRCIAVGSPSRAAGGTTYHSGVSWARSLPGPLRRPLSRLVHAAWDGAADLGAIGPDDPRGRRFGRMGPRRLPAVPPGRHLQRAPHPHRRRDHRRARARRITAGMAPGQEMPTDPVVSIGSRCLIGRGSHIVGHWEIVHRGRHPDRALRLHHRPEPHLRGPGRAHRAAVADRGRGAHRLGQLAGGQRRDPARAPRSASTSSWPPAPWCAARSRTAASSPACRRASCGAGSRGRAGSPRRTSLLP